DEELTYLYSSNTIIKYNADGTTTTTSSATPSIASPPPLDQTNVSTSLLTEIRDILVHRAPSNANDDPNCDDVDDDVDDPNDTAPIIPVSVLKTTVGQFANKNNGINDECTPY
ncbi:6065_t:CDS:2, partial [Paraglomus occultum]